jgi:CRP-like cAMP-binding protein
MSTVRGAVADDPLNYLPRTQIYEFPKGRTIYDEQQPPTSLYLVIHGRVKIVSTAEDGNRTVVRILRTESLFGEPAFLGAIQRPERAVALERVQVMAWPADQIERQIEREPRLGIALTQHVVRQCIQSQERILSMALYKTPERVMLAMVRLASELGDEQPDGLVRMRALTHSVIAEYVGTSREIVTFQMNRLRRLGILKYSRQYIDVNTAALQEMLRERKVATLAAEQGGVANAALE